MLKSGAEADQDFGARLKERLGLGFLDTINILAEVVDQLPKFAPDVSGMNFGITRLFAFSVHWGTLARVEWIEGAEELVFPQSREQPVSLRGARTLPRQVAG
jgi:hypothetical protein